MASLIDELINVLAEETEEYKILYKLAHEKTPVIVKGDVEKLQEFTAEEQLHLEKIIKSEKKREEVVTDIASVLNIDKGDVTVRKLLVALKNQKEVVERLSQVHSELKKTLKEFTAVNDINKSLLRDSLDMAEFNLNLIRSMNQAPELANYNSSSTYSSDMHIEQRGIFDAKQ
ncbi:MAG: flagellar protein FlgN [Lachnospiraceae bacterium]|nr:flagellar protein FlgN [Lachnospiraceae bacterium]